MKIEGTAYEVFARPVFGSDRWRWEILTASNGRYVTVTTSTSTYRTAEIALEEGARRARGIAKRLRRDLGQDPKLPG